MFSDLNVLRLAHAMATHAGQRQGVIASNIAQADTPGYKARDIPDFADSLRRGGADRMRATRAGHLDAPGPGQAWAERAVDGPTDPNGNSVSLELQMMQAAEVKSQHDRAIAIYRTSLGILRTSLGRG